MPSMRSTRRTTSPLRSHEPNARVWRFCRNLWIVIHEKRARKLHKLLCGRVNLRSVLPPRDIFASGNELAFVMPEQVRTRLPGPFVRGVSVTGVWDGRGAAARISRQKKIGCASSVSRWTGLNMKTYRSSAAHAGANGFVLSVGGRRAALIERKRANRACREQRRRDGRVPVGRHRRRWVYDHRPRELPSYRYRHALDRSGRQRKINRKLQLSLRCRVGSNRRGGRSVWPDLEGIR